MTMSPAILLVAVFSYTAILFVIARFGDKKHFVENSWVRHPLIYALALGVYCTSWTFYGLVGTASEKGLNFLPILLGPALVFTIGYPLVERIYKICQQEHIHSITDFLASRYGKRQGVATTISLVVLLATIPYIALQLKAVSDSLRLILGPDFLVSQDLTLVIVFSMIAFTLAFGARRLDMSGYHSGLMLAIAYESLVKIVVLCTIAVFSLIWIYQLSGNGVMEALGEQRVDGQLLGDASGSISVFYQPIIWPRFLVETLLSACAIFCLPRMFHISFVECLSLKHLRSSRWFFFGYLVLISLFIVFITSAGNLLFTNNDIEGDTFMIALPLMQGNQWLTVFAFIGGFSAATAMIIVATITLSYMLSNDVIFPLIIRYKKSQNYDKSLSRYLMFARRCFVICIILGAYFYQGFLAENIQLTSMGLVAFALIAQLAPGVLFGLLWGRGNAAGLYAGLIVGLFLWFYTFIVPLLSANGLLSGEIVEIGLWGIDWLRPESLFNLTFSDSFTRSVIISLGANIVFYCWYSLSSAETLNDKVQAAAFTRLEKSQYNQYEGIDLADIKSLLHEFLGRKNTDSLLATYQIQLDEKENRLAKLELIDKVQQALASVAGVASSQAMIQKLSSGNKIAAEEVVNLFGHARKALKFNRDILSASFENISSGISVVDVDLRLTAWNQRYEDMFHYPEGILYVGMPVAEIIRFNAKRGLLGDGDVEEHVNKRLQLMNQGEVYRVVRQHSDEKIIEIKGQPMPSGGYVTSYDDITAFIHTQKKLEDMNAHLEERVQRRTQALAKTNIELVYEIQQRSQVEEKLREAKKIADAANASKTKFLALASHDIMQPLNAANLYMDRLLSCDDHDGKVKRQLKSAIENTESIISSLIEVSKLDNNRLQAHRQVLNLDELLSSIVNDFTVQCPEGIQLDYVKTSLWVNSDPHYLRRIIQNFMSNAIKYTGKGRVLIGCRRYVSDSRQQCVRVCVYDNGIGIAESETSLIFKDFYRIKYDSGHTGQEAIQGLGLGLAVVLRFAELLSHDISCDSVVGKGSCFSVSLPIEEKLTVCEEQNKATSFQLRLGLSVLYVDDDRQNLLAIESLLTGWGCDITLLNSIVEAQEYVARREAIPDILLMDYQLDQATTTGIALADSMLQVWSSRLFTSEPSAEYEFETAQLPQVCIVSAAVKPELAVEAKAKSFHFLRKPINVGRLRALLMQIAQNLSIN